MKNINKFMTIKFIPLLICFASIFVYSEGMSNKAGWELLLNNKVDSAKEVFSENINNKSTAAEAYRALSVISEIRNQIDSISYYIYKSYSVDHDIFALGARMSTFHSWHYGINKKADKLYASLLKEIVDDGNIFSGQSASMLIQYYLNIGNIKNAQAVYNEMGVIDNWKVIGPFDNISNSGFNKQFGPELSLDSKKEYVGKDGNIVGWKDLVSPAPHPWVFMENHIDGYNSVNYLYCNINSKKEQKALLSFGSSSTFKIFLNNQVIMQDSIFRNTANDIFIEEVTLKKGENTLLLKLGHEEGNPFISNNIFSNFSIRLLNRNYKKLEDISTSTQLITNNDKATTNNYGYKTPLIDTVTSLMNSRLSKDSTDIDAALMLISLFNSSDMTNKSQRLINRYIKMYPKSSLLYTLLGESLARSGKKTNAEIAMNKAYELDKTNFSAWAKKINQLIEENSLDQLEKFLNNSPSYLQKSPLAIQGYLLVYMKYQDRNKIFESITKLEELGGSSELAASMLLSMYMAMGHIDKTVDLLTNFLQNNHLNEEYYLFLANVFIKQGKMEQAMETYQKMSLFNPSSPIPSYYLSLTAYNNKDYESALKYVNQCINIKINSSLYYNLKANILASMDKKDEAVLVFNKSIKYTGNDFIAWEGIWNLNNKPGFDSITPLPDIDSLINVSKSWTDSLTKKTSVISLINDVYLYPSRCSRERYFLMLKLGSQDDIDYWKEYKVSLNASYQTYSINRAFTRKESGTVVEADKYKNSIVFKSIEPGDYIVLEYSRFNYYSGRMASEVYGLSQFILNYPSYSQQLRLVHPVNDTIPYQKYGDDISLAKKVENEFQVTSFSSKMIDKDLSERYVPDDYKDKQKVIYSTFNSWKDISQWYYDICRYKQRETIEIKELADSLFKDTKTIKDKAARVHEFITNKITYSNVPFRQSGWIPQDAKEVLATRIGDCKDMASLGKSLLDIAGVTSNLVLVNTDIKHFIDHAYIGPNFNHCILAYHDGKEYLYIDFTDKFSSIESIPYHIQGAMALLIDNKSDSLFTIPILPADAQTIERNISIKLLADNSMEKKVETIRRGSFSAGFKSNYRYKTEEEKKKNLEEVLQNTYPDIDLKDFSIEDLDNSSDKVSYNYEYTATNALTEAGNTCIFDVHILDNISASDFPVSSDRTLPIDVTKTRFGISKTKSTTEILFPANYKIINMPESVQYKTKYGEYNISYTFSNSKLIINRFSNMNYNKIYSPDEFKAEIDFLKKVSVADNVQLVFKKQ